MRSASVVASGLCLLALSMSSQSRADFIGGLDGVSLSSTFDTDAIAALPTLGWTAVAGAAQVFDLPELNGGLIGQTPYDNYSVEYRTGTVILPNRAYSLSVLMGFFAEIRGGQAEYLLELGTISGAIFTSLVQASGSVEYLGSMSAPAPVYSGAASLNLVTGSMVSGEELAVRWAQTSTAGLSDYFGIDNALLRSSVVNVTEPRSQTLLGLGLVMLGLARRRRAWHRSPPVA